MNFSNIVFGLFLISSGMTNNGHFSALGWLLAKPPAAG
jgi:hypothetical protein